MKLYEQLPGLLYSRGKLKDSHVEDLLAGRYAVIQLAPPKANPKIAAALHPHFYHMPVPDGRLTDKSRNTFLLAADYALININQGRPVIVHCNAGRNRAGLLSALVLRKFLGISGAEALERVRSVRPRAVANPEFEKWLLTLKPPRKETTY